MKGIEKKDFYIKEIEKNIANEIVVNNHYLHRRPQNKYSFGLFCKNTNKLVGVCIYGTPPNRSLQIGICGKDFANEVIELNRLWIDDCIGKNAESFLIGNTIKMIKEKIIVSYAEKGVGHTGYVYQATNFIYTGLSAKRTDLKIKGVETKGHSRHISDKYGGQKKAREILGDKCELVERPRKHRYIYFNCDRKTKKNLMQQLKYKIESYPKQKGGINEQQTK